MSVALTKVSQMMGSYGCLYEERRHDEQCDKAVGRRHAEIRMEAAFLLRGGLAQRQPFDFRFR